MCIRDRVGSSVISLKRYEKPVVDVDDEKLMFKIIRASFNQRRKTLANGLNNFGGMGLTKEQDVYKRQYPYFSAIHRTDNLNP